MFGRNGDGQRLKMAEYGFNKPHPVFLMTVILLILSSVFIGSVIEQVLVV